MTALLPQVCTVAERLAQETRAIRQHEFDQVVGMLSPEQRQQAKDLLSDFFVRTHRMSGD